MSYEKDIPDYAMVPAKEIKEIPEKIITPVTKGALYSQVQATSISEKPKTVIVIEEDILVPDTKPDMHEILLIDGKARLGFREVNLAAKGEEPVDIVGDVDIQTLYIPENQQECNVISVQTRVPFKDRWHTKFMPGAVVSLDCRPEKTEFMVINERKYRVKISLAVTARECAERKIDVFEGLCGEEIQTLKEKVEITNVALRKKDTISISETLDIKEELPVENILRQDISAVENYKQVTGEKVIINGFVYVNLLYSAAGEPAAEEDGIPGGEEGLCGCAADRIKQAQTKVEFTQFVPLPSISHQSGVNVTFDDSSLRVRLVNHEEEGEVLRLEGEIVTYIEVYSNMEKEIIVDGYHREKDFICDFNEEKCRTLTGTWAGETSVREIISPDPAFGEVEKIIFTTAEILSWESRTEQNKIITEGKAAAKIICQSRISKGEPPQLFSLNHEIPFRIMTTLPQSTGREIISDKIYIKEIWSEKINGKQIEFNGTVVVNSEIMQEQPFKVLVNPAFEESTVKERQVPMVVYVAAAEDDLWSIAKKFKTTADTISRINRLDGRQPEEGQKLLIMK